MLVTLINILRIIGIVLLYIIVVLLLFILLALFVPIRYRAKGNYASKKFTVKCKASFLFGMISLVLGFYEGKFAIKLKLFGKVIKENKEKSKHPNSKSCKKQSHDEEGDNPSNVEQDDDTSKDEKVEDTSKDEQDEDKSKSKLHALKDKAIFYINLYKEDNTKAAIDVIKHRLIKLLKAIMPHKGRINIYFGYSDAGITGKIVGIYKALYSAVKKVVRLYSYYDREITEADFDIRGRIYAFVVIYHTLNIILNKNVVNLYKKIKKRK